MPEARKSTKRPNLVSVTTINDDGSHHILHPTWACPQTMFLEHVFRHIEHWIDGDATPRKKLAKAPY